MLEPCTFKRKRELANFRKLKFETEQMGLTHRYCIMLLLLFLFNNTYYVID